MPNPRLRGLLLLACAGIAACGGKSDTDAPPPPAVVTTTTLQPVRWSDELTAPGTANARESVTISASVAQTVSEIRFDSGQFVKKGQPLVVLTQGQQAAGVAEAQAELRDAQQQYARSRQLADQQLIARSALETQRAALDAAQARVATQRAAVADHIIRAPFDGVLGLRLVSVGALVTPGTPIATLDDVSVIKLDFTLPEASLPLLRVDQPVSARSDAWPGETFSGRIATIESRIDPATRAVTVRAEVPNPDGRLRPGMLLQVAVERGARQAIAIPELALQQTGDVASVFRVAADGQSVRQIPVTTGARRRGQVEIVSGLKAGDRIVVEGTVKLRDGSAIRDASAQGAPASAAAMPAAGT